MAKRTDVELRIRSKNLAKKDLRDLNTELETLVETQERQSNAATLASRSLRDLNAEQRQLAKLASELSRRRDMIENLIGRQGELKAAKDRLNAIRVELAELLSTKAKGNFLGDIDKAIKTVKTELASAEKVFDRTAKGVDKLDDSLKAIGVNTEDAAGALAEVTASAERAQNAVAGQTADINRYSAAVDEAAASARRLSQAQRFDQNAAELERVQGIHDRFAVVLARNEKYQRALAAQTDRATRSIQRQGGAVRGASSSMDRYASLSGRAADSAGLLADTGRKSLSVYQRLRGELLAATAAYIGLYEAVSLLAQAVTVSQQRQSLYSQLLRANAGNARYAAEDQAFLRAEAERLGLAFDDLAKKYANFSISGKAAGLTTAQVRTAFSQATETVVGARLSAEDADGVFRAFIQIVSKSRVQAEELRNQLGDRLPGAVAKFAEANDIALADLDEKLKAGELGIEEFLNFLRLYAKESKQAVEENSKTLFADINRLKTAYNDFLELLANSGTSDELQKAVQSLTAALEGQQGKQFAKELAAAFSAVLRVLQFVIENFDTFLTLIKAFIALQAAKAVYGLATSVVEMGRGLVTTVGALRNYYTAAVAARTAGVALTASQSAFLAVLGPLGIAIGVVAGAIFGLQRAAAAAEADMNSFIDVMKEASSVKTTAEVGIAEASVQQRLDQSIDKLERLRQIQKDLNSANPVKGFGAVFRGAAEDVFTFEEVQIAITTELEKQEGLQLALSNLQRKRIKLGEKERLEDEARRKEEEARAAAAAAAAAGDGPTAKQLRAAANKRANAARAIQKEILDLDQEIFDTRIAGEVRTAEQVEKNYELTIRKIEARIAEQRLELQKLEQNARTANDGNLTTSDTALLEAARARVDALNLALNARAMETSLLQDVAINERAVNDLIAERDAKIAAVNERVQLGLLTEIEGRREALAIQQQYAGSITNAVDTLIAMLQALPPDLFARLGAAKLIADLELVRIKATQVKTEIQLIGENLGGQFAAGAAQAFGVLAKGVAGFLQGANSIGDAFKAASDAFRSFLADFLVGIGQAIIQAIILRAIMNAINGTSGGYAGAVMGVLSGVNHTGGIVGQDGATRWAPISAFQNAQRFHDGGLPGLKSNEVPTILERGEEVLTADDPRHALNGGKGPAGGNTTIINTIDSPSVIEAGLPSKAGTKTLVNIIKANRASVRAALGV